MGTGPQTDLGPGLIEYNTKKESRASRAERPNVNNSC